MDYLIYVKDNATKQISFVKKDNLQQAKKFILEAMNRLAPNNGIVFHMDGKVSCGQYEAKYSQVPSCDQDILLELASQVFTNQVQRLGIMEYVRRRVIS